MQPELQAVLDLQPSWVQRGPSDEMDLRGLYIRGDIVAFSRARAAQLADLLGCPIGDLAIEGSNGVGSFARVPWVRIADRRRSPSPRDGWYVVYLFAEDGDAVSISLNQGTQVWDGSGLRSQPLPLFRRWARGHALVGAAAGGGDVCG